MREDFHRFPGLPNYSSKTAEKKKQEIWLMKRRWVACDHINQPAVLQLDARVSPHVPKLWNFRMCFRSCALHDPHRQKHRGENNWHSRIRSKKARQSNVKGRPSKMMKHETCTSTASSQASRLPVDTSCCLLECWNRSNTWPWPTLSPARANGKPHSCAQPRDRSCE